MNLPPLEKGSKNSINSIWKMIDMENDLLEIEGIFNHWKKVVKTKSGK